MVIGSCANPLEGDNLCGGSCSDFMVFASNTSRLWGFGAPSGADIFIRLDNLTIASGKVISDGSWKVNLPQQESRSGYNLTIIIGQNSRTLVNVAFGLVFLCGGQSNMEWPVSRTINASDYISESVNFSDIRITQVCPGAGGNGHIYPCPNGRVSNVSTPQKFANFDRWGKSNQSWAIVSPQTVGGFSATCYYTARELYLQLKARNAEVPIGLVHNSLSGSCVQAWTSPTGIVSCPDTDKECPGRFQAQYRCSAMYNGAIAPFLPMRLDAVLWYQGECNSGNPSSYSCRFPALINDWRTNFAHPTLPFFYVELDPPQSPMIRQAQRAALTLNGTNFIPTFDIGCSYVTKNCFGVHSPRKQEVGRRLALKVLSIVCGIQDLVIIGPVLTNLSISSTTYMPQDITVIMHFTNAEGLHLHGTADCAFANNTSQKNGTVGPCCTESPFIIRANDGSWTRTRQL